MNDTQSTRRSIGDKLLILGAHLNAHPELPDEANVDFGPRVLTVQLHNNETTGLRAWAATLADVTWTAADFRKDAKGEPRQNPTWHAYLYGDLALLKVHVWCGINADFADSTDAVIAKLSGESRETTALVEAVS